MGFFEMSPDRARPPAGELPEAAYYIASRA
jgi:hypothetical protein